MDASLYEDEMELTIPLLFPDTDMVDVNLTHPLMSESFEKMIVSHSKYSLGTAPTSTPQVGSFICILWEADGQLYMGQVIMYNRHTQMHRILYDAEETIEWEDIDLHSNSNRPFFQLPDPMEWVRFLNPASPKCLIGRLVFLFGFAPEPLNINNEQCHPGDTHESIASVVEWIPHNTGPVDMFDEYTYPHDAWMFRVLMVGSAIAEEVNLREFYHIIVM